MERRDIGLGDPEGAEAVDQVVERPIVPKEDVGLEEGLEQSTNVAGSGAAWVNLHLADRTIGRQKQWHSEYSLCAVGAKSIPAGAKALDEASFKTIDDQDTIVAALE